MKQIHFASIDSTNLYLKNNYENYENLTFVSTDKQTSGKGRNGHIWESDDNNLLFSLLIKDQDLYSKANLLSILFAYIVIQVLHDYGISNLSIKWPNDVYVNDKKICGILLEAISKKQIECLIVGVGINVNQEKFKEEYKAISLRNILAKEIKINEIKEKLYLKIIETIEKVKNGKDYYEEIKKYDYLVNKNVYVKINNELQLVNVKGINKDYSLCVLLDNKEYNLNSGEVSLKV